jgi:hypothetical protein
MSASMGSECVEFAEKEFSQLKELKILVLGIKHTGFSFHGVSSEEYVWACDEVISAIEKYESTTTIQVIPQDILHEKYATLTFKGFTFKQNH